MFLHQQLIIVCVSTVRFFVIALDGFSALQFTPPAPIVLAEIKVTIFYNVFCLFILRLELFHNAI